MKRSIGYWIWALLLLAGCREEQPPELRVLTYNIHHGETIEGEMDLEAMAAVINAARPHLAALQEVDVRTDRVGGRSLIDELSELCRMEAYFGKAFDFDGGQYGNGILSAYPILTGETHPLPSSPDHEPRVAAAALIRLPDGDTLRFISTHFDHIGADSDRPAQAEALYRLFHEENHPSILAGDLNDTPGSVPLRIITRHWTASAPDSALRAS